MFAIITLHNFGFFNIINSYQEIIAIKLFFKNRTDNLKEEHQIGTPLHTADTISSSVLLMKHVRHDLPIHRSWPSVKPPINQSINVSIRTVSITSPFLIHGTRSVSTDLSFSLMPLWRNRFIKSIEVVCGFRKFVKYIIDHFCV